MYLTYHRGIFNTVCVLSKKKQIVLGKRHRTRRDRSRTVHRRLRCKYSERGTVIVVNVVNYGYYRSYSRYRQPPPSQLAYCDVILSQNFIYAIRTHERHAGNSLREFDFNIVTTQILRRDQNDTSMIYYLCEHTGKCLHGPECGRPYVHTFLQCRQNDMYIVKRRPYSLLTLNTPRAPKSESGDYVVT